MTMPTLIQKQQEKATVTQLKKFNSVMNQAFQMAVSQHGEVPEWDLNVAGMGLKDPTEEELAVSQKSQDKLIDIFAPYLKTTSICKYQDNTCSSAKQYTRYSLNGIDFGPVVPRINLADGASITGLTVANSACERVDGTTNALQHICGEIFVDLNGPKPPNTSGKDIFYFYITKYGIIPQGGAETTSDWPSFGSYCNMSKTSKGTNGYGCAAWLIYNENMDYLHCNDLSWGGKKKCN